MIHSLKSLLPAAVLELPLPSRYINTAAMQEQMGNKNTVAGDQAGVHLPSDPLSVSQDSFEGQQC